MVWNRKAFMKTAFFIVFQAPQPLNMASCSIMKAMQAALELEETVYKNLLKVHDIAEKDPEVGIDSWLDNDMRGWLVLPCQAQKSKLCPEYDLILN